MVARALLFQPGPELDHETSGDHEGQPEPRRGRYALPEDEAATEHADRREDADVHAEQLSEFPGHEIDEDPIAAEHDDAGDDEEATASVQSPTDGGVSPDLQNGGDDQQGRDRHGLLDRLDLAVEAHEQQ